MAFYKSCVHAVTTWPSGFRVIRLSATKSNASIVSFRISLVSLFIQTTELVLLCSSNNITGSLVHRHPPSGSPPSAPVSSKDGIGSSVPLSLQATWLVLLLVPTTVVVLLLVPTTVLVWVPLCFQTTGSAVSPSNRIYSMKYQTAYSAQFHKSSADSMKILSRSHYSRSRWNSCRSR